MERNLVDSNNVSESNKMKGEQGCINFLSIPSLESMAAIKVATGLFTHSEIDDTMRKHLINSYNYRIFFMQMGEQMDKLMIKKLSLLPLPGALKAKLSNIIRPIGLQILEWIRDTRFLGLNYIGSICWTAEGTIDKVKTLKLVIYADSSDMDCIYELACEYCLEDSIHNIWHKLPEEKQKYFLCRKSINDERQYLVAYWTSTINNGLSGLFSETAESDCIIYNSNTSYNMFRLALREGNCLAVKYFWNKLTQVERSNNLAQWINNAVQLRKKRHFGRYQYTCKEADILYFLLSKMSDGEQQKKVLQNNIDVILNSLFKDWPWQRHLLPTIQIMWEFIDEELYVKLLSSIVEEIEENRSTSKLFRELLYNSPLNLKKCFIQRMNSDYGKVVLSKLLIVEDVGTIKDMLNYFNSEDQKRIFSLTERKELFEVFYAGKLSLFDALISESDVKERIVLKLGNKLCHSWICHNNWNMVGTFLNWAFTSQDQIDYFKNEIIEKIEITSSLVLEGNYDLVNQFMDWCFDSKQKINRFKQCLAISNPDLIGGLSVRGWCAFKRFVDYCFDSQQEINDFKSAISKSPHIIFNCIEWGYECEYNFKFTDKLINWCCCHSMKKIKQYKGELVLSKKWIDILKRVYNDDFFGELDRGKIDEFMKLFSPLEKDVITQLKENITKCMNFRQKSYLFCLLDLSHDISDNDSSDNDSSDNDSSTVDSSTVDSSTVDSSTVDSSTDDDSEPIQNGFLRLKYCVSKDEEE